MAYFVAPVAGRISSDYGTRVHPITGARGFHRGIDIAAPQGTPVVAAYGGTVRQALTGRTHRDGRPNPVTGTWNTGNAVIIDGPGGGSELYGHLHTVDVRVGQTVKAGDRIGTVGQTGNVTGPHLHFETWNGRTQGGGVGAGNTRDPKVDFAKYGVTPGKSGSGGTAPSRPSTGGGGGSHILPQDVVRERVRASGIPRPADGLLSTWVRRWQERQLYKPGLVADGVWGPASEAHYQWTRTLQSTMRGWKGSRDTAIDGDYYTATRARVREIQDRNHGGAYRGALDSIPGPVFCRMLGINPHPGL